MNTIRMQYLKVDSESLMQRHYTPEQRNRMDNAMQRKRDPERSRREIEEAKKEIRETRKRRREVPQHLRFQRYIIEVTDSDLSSDVDPPVGTGGPPRVPPSGGPPTVAAMPPQMVTPETASSWAKIAIRDQINSRKAFFGTVALLPAQGYCI
ncbi:Hypothetical protein SMAX5B_000732 [Scophthalmus maximus]|uniref:Uncharacterized protein n=1 Tax=Scophthalmus maximus TaxID=52904 RepID=A0A2U9B5V8_SCOMX|nr:Hypothetical protein SMAX5B_000732 [Scophthalmus maximus]